MLSNDRLLMTLLVRNEEDILPYVLEFHREQGVDHFIVTDNLSTDSTRDILRHYEKMGWLTLLEEHSDDYDQEAWVTRMAILATDPDFSAGWIIHSDADEFWLANSGTLHDYFSTLDPTVNIVSAKRHNFICQRENASIWYENMVFRKSVSLNYRGKLLPDKIAHRPNQNVRIAQGNHSVFGIASPLVRHDGIEILHFPIRSLSQIEQKIRLGGAAYARNTRQPAETGMGWRRLYAQLMAEGNLTSYFNENSASKNSILEALDRNDILLDDRIEQFFKKRQLSWSSK